MHHALAQAVLAHSMAQSTLELLALIGPFAIIFGAGAVLVIGPVVRGQGECYSSHPAAAADPGTAPSDPVATSDESPAPVT